MVGGEPRYESMEEARQKELASERQAKELAALGVKSDDSDDIATRILKRRAAARARSKKAD